MEKPVSEHGNSAQKLSERYREEQWQCALFVLFGVFWGVCFLVFLFCFAFNQDMPFWQKKGKKRFKKNRHLKRWLLEQFVL